ncbi:MAG: hypothetical protein QOE63_1547 [Acidimicrobiaceae bacterium]
MELPPDDPDEWSEDQWMTYLHDTEFDAPTDKRVFAPRLDSAGSHIMGAAMTGLANAIYGEQAKPDVVIEAEANGKDDGMKIDLDPDDPGHSTVVIPAPGA